MGSSHDYLPSSEDDFRSRVATICLVRGISFSELCLRAGVDEGRALEAILLGREGLPESSNILVKLSNAAGVGPEFIFDGDRRAFVSDQERAKVFELICSYCTRSGTPPCDRMVLVREIMGRLDQLPTDSMTLAARARMPKTMIDMRYEHDRLIRDGRLVDRRRRSNGNH